MNSKPAIYVVDDDSGIRDALGVLLESCGYDVTTFDNGRAFLDKLDQLHSGCLLLDVRIPDISGLELLERLGSRANDFPAIIMTGYADLSMAVRALRAGAVDFVEKPFSDDEILKRVSNVLAKCAEAARPEDTANALIATLTPREKEVLAHLVLGKQNKIIAYELGISSRTVEIHRANVMKKLEANNIAELVRRTMNVPLAPM